MYYSISNKREDLSVHQHETVNTAKHQYIMEYIEMDRSRMDTTEAEDIKKRWQEYTEELYKKRSSQPRAHSPRARQPGM